MSVHPNDSRRVPYIAFPPGAHTATRVYDVLLVEESRAFVSPAVVAARPPIGTPPVQLGNGLSIGHLPAGVNDVILSACTMRGHYFFAAPIFSIEYAFIRELPLAAALEFEWDTDSIIATSLALSRLVLDNAYNAVWAARVTEFSNGEMRVIPHDAGELRRVYRWGNERE